MDHDAQERAGLFIAQRPHLLRLHPLPLDRDAAPQRLQHLRGRMAIDECLVLLLDPIARVGDAKGDVAIVGQQQEPRRLPVESADRHHSLRHLDEIEHGATPPLVAGGGDVAGWFVEHDVAATLPLDAVTVNANIVLCRIDLSTKLTHDLAVDRHPAGENQLLRLAARSDAVRC